MPFFPPQNMLVIEEIRGKSRLCLIVAPRLHLSTKEQLFRNNDIRKLTFLNLTLSTHDHILVCLAKQTLSIRPSQRGCSPQLEIQRGKTGKMAKEWLARKPLFLLWSSTLTVSPARPISATTIASRKDQPRRKRRMVLALRWGLPDQRVFTFHPCHLQKEKGLLSQP